MVFFAKRAIEILEEFNVSHLFDPDAGMLPYAQALVDVANEHFAFFSVDGWPRTGGLGRRRALKTRTMLVWTELL